MASIITNSCLCIASIGALCITLSDLKTPESRITYKQGLILFGLGCIFFTSFEKCLEKILSETKFGSYLFQKYQLRYVDAIEVANKLCSAIQAMICTYVGWSICNYSCRRSVKSTTYYLSDCYAWFGAAYFFTDIWHMYQVYKLKTITSDDIPWNNRKHFIEYCYKNPVMVFHHVFIGTFGLLTIVYLRGDCGDCVFGFLYLMETSTPFVNLRSILSIFRMKNTPLYALNGIIMIITFLIFRILMWPYAINLFGSEAKLNFIQAFLSLPTICKIGAFILFVPQLYWFILILHGAIKVFIIKNHVHGR